MTFRTRITLVTLLLCTLFVFGKTAHAQGYLIDNTIRCSVPNCLDITEGTLWYLQIEVTALAVWNGNGVNLDAYADVAANGCSVSVIGQVDGGAAVGALGNEIGILAHSMGAIPPFEADYTEINYLDGSLGISGGGSYPC